ncbi:MAG TPA: 16S rRNA (guanine(966)-N(2))-methyltransferase RsmD [Acidimicrobiales bacterium]|nr:16S rRNA (guanine(966)-N(2))-methyltransferase RsmD [Acidimicrobiales bacterium]
MRVVAGTARGRRLVAPRGLDVRPTTDRAREAIGNRLTSMGVLTDAQVLDLFAGTGAMGIEALSRGAAHATFVENAPAALRAIEQNLSALGFSEQSTVVRADASSFRPPAPVDIAFVDPPYTWDGWGELLSLLPGGLVVCEARHPVVAPDGWQLVRSDRYGTTVITLLQQTRRGSP